MKANKNRLKNNEMFTDLTVQECFDYYVNYNNLSVINGMSIKTFCKENNLTRPQFIIIHKLWQAIVEEESK